MQPEPTIRELLDDAANGVRGLGDKTSDYLTGSDYQSLSGPNAVLWSRQARRDTDLFNAARLHGARDEDLTNMVLERYGVQRYLDTYGVGAVSVRRPTTAGGAGTFWKGTRIAVYGGSTLKLYRVRSDTPVGAADLVATVPVESTEYGPTGQIAQAGGLRFEDLVWDSTWAVEGIVVGPGTLFEPAADLIARVRQVRLDARPGHVKRIEDVCREVGAGQVALFQDNYADASKFSGLNMCYVGDLGYTGTDALVKACFLALRKARVLGDHLQVRPMARVPLAISADVYLRTSPAELDIARLEQAHHQAVRQYLGGTSGGFSVSKIGISTAIARPTPEVQRVVVVSPGSDLTVTTGGIFPATLNRYVVDTIAIRYHGP